MKAINKIIFFIVLLLILAGKTPISAQPFVDILSLQYQKFQKVNASDTTNDMLSSDQRMINFFLPIEFDNKDVLIIGGIYDNYAFKMESELDSVRIGKITSTALFLGGVKQWNEKWSTLILAIPRLSSDFERINDQHMQMGGVVINTIKKSDDLKFKFGLFYNRDFFGNFWMPLAGIDWNVSEHLNIFGVLPGSMNVEYKLHDRWYTGIAYKSITASFRVSDQAEKYYIREGHRFWGHNQLRGFLNFYPMKNIVLFVEGGHTAWRRYEIYENGNENKKLPLPDNPVYRQFQNGFFMSVGISLRVRLDGDSD